MSLFQRLRADAAEPWRAYTEHEFVRQVAAGTLPTERFRDYLQQDYLFLIQFARANALAGYKSRTLADLREASDGLAAILEETRLHERLCARWGVTAQALAAVDERAATIAYTRYVLDRGAAGDLLDLQVALAPCILGYAEIGTRAAEVAAATPDHPYAEWIAEYAGAEYQATAHAAQQRMDRVAVGIDAQRFADLADIFRTATRLEADFWQQSLTV